VIFQSSIALGLQLRNYPSGHFPFAWKYALVAYLRVVLKKLWCLAAQLLPARLFSLKPSAEDMPRNAFGARVKVKRGKRLQLRFPSLPNLVYRPSQPLVKLCFWFLSLANCDRNRVHARCRGCSPGPAPAIDNCTASSTLFFQSNTYVNICKE